MTSFVENVNEPEKKVNIDEDIVRKNTDDSLQVEMNDYLAKFLDMSNDAKENETKEKTMPLSEGIKTFPKAAAWSIVLSTALVMEGYDTNLINSFYAFPSFNEKYGEYVEKLDAYSIDAKWQTTLSMCSNVGEIIGLFAAGIIADKIGYRWTLIGSLVLTTAFIFIVFFAKDIGMLVAGELLLGLPWGAFQTLTVTYASEVCPLVLRVYLTTYVNVCWVFGQLISSGVLRAFVDSTAHDSYRIPFAIQWIWPLPIMVGIFLAPESPWWCVKKGRLDQAKRSLKRLISANEHLPDTEVLANAMVNKMQLTIEKEYAISASASYWDCFKGSDWRRTRIAAGVWVVQNITGSALMGYSTYFYQQAGLATSMAFTFSIIQYIFGIIGTFGSWFLSRWTGRFNIYFSGLCIQIVILLVVGGLGCSSDKNASWGIGALLWVFTFVYDFTVGPLCYCIVAEIPSVRLRTKTVVIARNAYNIAGIVIAVITPHMLNPESWNWKAKTGFFWAGFAVVSAIWVYFELPETKGKTFADLDALFDQKTKARKFKTTEVETFNVGTMMEALGEEGIKAAVQHNENQADRTEKV
ncbi:maltose permease [Meyerozyma guilliermondii]